MNLRSLVALAAITAAMSGCAFIDTSVSPPSAAQVVTPSSRGAGREVTIAFPFVDRRADPTRCGMKKNGYNADTADVHCTVPPTVWIAQALADGLTAAGFRVVRNEGPTSGTSVRIDGELLQFFIEPKIGFLHADAEADISVRLIARSPAGLYAERVFYLKGIENMDFQFSDEFEAAAAASTKLTVTAMVDAIASLLDRYPQLGTNAGEPLAAVTQEEAR